MITFIAVVLSALAAPPLGGNPTVSDAEVQEAVDRARGPGRLAVRSRLPAEVLVDGGKVAQLWYPGEVEVEIPSGVHVVRIYTKGEPRDVRVRVPEGGVASVLVGPSGITVADAAEEVDGGEPPAPSDASVVDVTFECVGQGAQVRLGAQRLVLHEGQRSRLELAPGAHPISVRSADGTVIWAAGTLQVAAGQGLVVQLSDGRLPEVFGSGRFLARGG